MHGGRGFFFWGGGGGGGGVCVGGDTDILGRPGGGTSATDAMAAGKLRLASQRVAEGPGAQVRDSRTVEKPRER